MNTLDVIMPTGLNNGVLLRVMTTFELNEQDLKNQFKFYSACTLTPDYLGLNTSGWTITGTVHEDYYRWVNDFTATHPDYGVVYGDFEVFIRATTKEAYEHFVKHHAPDIWDYGDI